MVDYSQILSRKYKDSEWTLNGDDYAGLTWLSETSKPTKEELDSYWNEVKFITQSETQAKAAQRQLLLDRLGITQEEAQLLLGGN
jgi:hypothetical protein